MNLRILLLLPFLLIFMTTLDAQNRFWGSTIFGGNDKIGIIYSTDDQGTNLQGEIHMTLDNPGSTPRSHLLSASDGDLYGMTSSGGVNSRGVLFRYDPDTDIYTDLYHFDLDDGSSPFGGLIQVGLKLYGLTSSGGSNNGGVIFEYDLNTATYQKLYDFNDATGDSPRGSLIEAANGHLYGMTSTGGMYDEGVIFQYNISMASYSVIMDLDNTNLNSGSNPWGSLLEVEDNVFYGMTRLGGLNDRGTIFKYDLGMSDFTILHHFALSQGSPIGSLITDGNGILYGLCPNGGTQQGVDIHGYVFTYDLVNSQYLIRYNFKNTFDGGSPQGDLLLASDGYLYGTTLLGDAIVDLGQIFRMDTIGFNYSELHAFDGPNGSNPSGSLIGASDNRLYGMSGGGAGHGVLFSLDTSDFTYHTEVVFNETEKGSYPVGQMLQAANGMVYGITQIGGSTNDGLLYEIDPVTKAFSVKHTFSEDDGEFPRGRLYQASNGLIYGTTYQKGSFGRGTIFSWDTETESFTTERSFTGFPSANYPDGGVVQVGGKLYGITQYGGNNNSGAMYSFDISSKAFEVLHSFDAGTNMIAASLLPVGDMLYGMTQTGGMHSTGTLYRYDLVDDTLEIMHDFETVHGEKPFGELVMIDGKLYGTTSEGGTNSKGTLFEFDTTGSGTIAAIHHFSGGMDGGSPQGWLMYSSGGKLYGSTNMGGIHNVGVLFEYDIDMSTYLVTHHFDTMTGASPTRSALVEVNPNFCPATYGSIDTTTCFSYLSPGGKTLASTGIYLDTLQNAMTCDSIITIDLVIESAPETCGIQPCAGNIAITPSILSSDPHQMIFQATMELTAEGLITESNAENITFRAENTIELIPEFEVEQGAVLTLEISGCD